MKPLDTPLLGLKAAVPVTPGANTGLTSMAIEMASAMGRS